jgi:hypothetical protein
MKTKIVTIVLLLTAARFGFSQGFMNLDFNSASIPNGTPANSFVPISSAIPGWTGYLGNNQQTSVLYNSGTIGSAAIDILDANNLGGVIPGNNYTVVLQAGNDGGNGGAPNATASIAQTAMIPSTAESIVFTASFPLAAGWQITLKGQPIVVSQIGTVGSYYGVYAGNVSAYAGQVDQLEFTALYGADGAENMSLDNIQFSSSPVPEPNSFGLFALGGLFIAFCHLRKSSPKVSPGE